MSTRFIQGLLVFFISVLLLFFIFISIFYSTSSSTHSPFYLKLYLFNYPKKTKAMNQIPSKESPPKLSIYIVKDQHKLFLWNGNEFLRAYSVGLGKNNATPTGSFSIKRKIKLITDPSTNPYGPYVFELSDPNYAIHGTKDLNSIGKNLSHGCIRMTNEQITELFSLITIQTPIHIVSTLSDSTVPETLKGAYSKNIHNLPLSNQKVLRHQQIYKISSADIQLLHTTKPFQWKG